MKKVIFGAANYWFSPYQVGSHYYATEFARNNWQVAFISDPVSPFHIFSKGEKKQLKERFKLFLKGGQWVKKQKIWTYIPFTFFPIYNKFFLKSDWVLNHSHNFFVPSLKKVLKKKGFDQVDLIWLDSLKQYYLLDLIKHKKSILRIADKNQGYQNHPLSLIEKEKKLIQRVDSIVVSSRLLFKEIEKIKKKNVFYLPNGTSFSSFNNNVSLPEEYKKIPQPRIVYVGSMGKRFDIDLVYFLAKKLKQTSFVFIGLPKINLKKISKLNNVFILGPKEHQQLPAYLSFSHGAIIPFLKNKLTDYITPIKLFEYFSFGLPVVSTNLEETKALNSPALLAQDDNDFLKKLRFIIDQPKFAEEETKKFIQDYTWEKSFKFLLKKVL